MRLATNTPTIYLITKGEATPANFCKKRVEILDTVGAAAEAGVDLVQLREKNLPARLIFELAVAIVALLRGSTTRLLINDRADIAGAAGADGVQLTSASLGADVVRKAFPPDFLIGVSAHSHDDVRQAAAGGADFALFGPVFETPGKGAGTGVSTLREVCTATAPLPVMAIGGVDADNFGSVIDAGAVGFAAIRALNDVGQLSEFVESVRNN